MKLISLLIGIVSFISVVSALANQDDGGGDTTTAKTTSATTVWITITTNGALATVKSTYHQSFVETYTSATSSAAAGTIGMGSISGSVGGVRTYAHTTVSGGAGDIQGSIYGRVVGMLVLLLGYLI
ncbi:predicted GPI-anchored protein 1 [[Candida] railenensis]|uniref:Predicted GPI-anchored protein 1 n=1 Tax=[Candida] railenensis TaxID=45579 RepID=A0A9P0VZ64_9ASCO|nr:predicted GPI-anchored protein 1 [[Candida] railenensis]